MLDGRWRSGAHAACLPMHEDRPTSPVGRLIPPKSIGATSLLLSSHCIPLLSKAGSRWPPVARKESSRRQSMKHNQAGVRRGGGVNCPRPNIRDWDQIDSIRTVGSHRAVGDAWCGGGGRQTGTVCQRCASKRRAATCQGSVHPPCPQSAMRCAAPISFGAQGERGVSTSRKCPAIACSRRGGDLEAVAAVD